jgi:hypothetical protein
MGTITAQAVLDKAVIQLNDLTSVRWSRPELFGWLNDAQRQIVLMQPSTSNFTTTLAMIAGTRQTIPIDGWLLLDVYRNMGLTGVTPGRAVRIVSKELMDGFNPDWHWDTPTVTAKNYVYDSQDQTAFWVYPPNTGTGYLQLNYARVPVDLTAESQPISVNDILQTAILDYVMYRACSKDAEYAPGLQLAVGYWSSFSSALGAKNAAESANSPNLTLTGQRGLPMPGAGS